MSHCPLAYQLGWGGPRGALPLSGKPSIEGRSTGSCLLPWELRAALIWEGTPESRGGTPCLGVCEASLLAGRCLKAGGTLADVVLLGHGVTVVTRVLPCALARPSARVG